MERSAATDDVDQNQVLNRSMETDAWMPQLQTPECSRSVQTQFDDDEEVNFGDVVQLSLLEPIYD